MSVSIIHQQLLKFAASLTVLTVCLAGLWDVSKFGVIESEANEIVDCGEHDNVDGGDLNGRRVQLMAPTGGPVALLQIQHETQPLPPLYQQTTTRGPPVA
jgi:hypothetical protein